MRTNCRYSSIRWKHWPFKPLAVLSCTSSAHRYTEPPLSSQNLSSPCVATAPRFFHFLYHLISRQIFSLKWCKNWCKTYHPFILHHWSLKTVGAVELQDFERPIERPHGLNLLISECLCVSSHCSADIPMSRNILKHLLAAGSLRFGGLCLYGLCVFLT